MIGPGTATAQASIAASSTQTVLVAAPPRGARIRVLSMLVNHSGAASPVTFNSNATAITPALKGVTNGVIDADAPVPLFSTRRGEALTVTTGSGSTTNIMVAYQTVADGSDNAPLGSAYQAAVLADSPLSYWRLGDLSGTTAVDTADSRPGTYTGGFTLGATGGLPHDTDKAVTLNGTTGWVSIADDAAFHLPNYSIEAWVNPTDRAASYEITKSNRNWDVSLDVNGKVNVSHPFVAGAPPSTTAVPTGSFSHVVATYDGVNVRIYINGNLDAGSPAALAAPAPAGGTTMSIGNDPVGVTRFFLGSLDEVAVYSTVLSAARVSAHFAAA